MICVVEMELKAKKNLANSFLGVYVDQYNENDREHMDDVVRIDKSHDGIE